MNSKKHHAGRRPAKRWLAWPFACATGKPETPPHYRRRLLGAAAGVALALSAALAGAAEARGAPRVLKVVTIAVIPYGMLDAQGKPAGLLVELADRLAQESGWPIENVVVPYARAVAMVVSGEADLMLSFINPSLLANARQLGSVSSSDIVIVGRAGTHFASLADLRGKTVGHIRGAEFETGLLAEHGVFHYETSSNELVLKMLMEGRLDAALGVRLGFFATLRQLGIARERLGSVLTLGRRHTLVHYSNKRYDPQVAADLVRAIDAMREQDAGTRIMNKYENGLSRQ